MWVFENFPNPEIWRVFEISVKSGKDRVSTPSLVIHRVRLKKTCKKVHISIQGGRGETQKTMVS